MDKGKFLVCYGEWFYGVEKPRIIIENYLDAGTGKEPTDYKVFCFDGKPKYIVVDTDRFVDHKRNVYDLSRSFKQGYSLNDIPMEVPKELGKLLKYAEQLSNGFPHMRVDLYIMKDPFW